MRHPSFVIFYPFHPVNPLTNPLTAPPLVVSLLAVSLSNLSTPPIFDIKQAPHQNRHKLISHSQEEFFQISVYSPLKRRKVVDIIKSDMLGILMFDIDENFDHMHPENNKDT